MYSICFFSDHLRNHSRKKETADLSFVFLISSPIDRRGNDIQSEIPNSCETRGAFNKMEKWRFKCSRSCVDFSANLWWFYIKRQWIQCMNEVSSVTYCYIRFLLWTELLCFSFKKQTNMNIMWEVCADHWIVFSAAVNGVF